MDEWIVVLDEDDSLSHEQLEVCQALRPALKGALVCHAGDDPRNETLCNEVEHFPAFCHAPTNACVYGLRETQDDFEALATIPVPAHTTPPPPPPPQPAPP